MGYSFVERQPFTVVGIRRTTPCAAGTWAIAHEKDKRAEAEKLLGKFYDLGICFGFLQDGSNDYMCAVEYGGDAPEGLDSFAYPLGRWVKFEAKGPTDELGKVWGHINNEFLPQNNLIKAHPPIEKYILWDSEADKCDVEIWVPVKENQK